MYFTISKKLFLLSIFSASALILSGIYSLYNLRSTFQWIGEVYRGAAVIEKMNSDLGLPLAKLRELSLSIVMSPNREQQVNIREQSKDLIARLSDYFDEASLKYNEDFDPEEEYMYRNILISWEQYTKLVDYTAQHVLNGYREAAFINVSGAEKQQFELLFRQFSAWQRHKVSEGLIFTPVQIKIIKPFIMFLFLCGFLSHWRFFQWVLAWQKPLQLLYKKPLIS